MRLPVSVILILGISVSAIAGPEVPFNGKKGEALHSAVAAASKPAHSADLSALTLTMPDPFSGASVSVEGGTLPAPYIWTGIVPAEWWGNAPEEYRSMVAADILNLMAVTVETQRLRGDLVPGEVTQPSFYNSFWSVGLGEIYGTQTELYSPPQQFRGQLARAYFYMSTVYHTGIWTPRAYMMMTTASFPGLSAYAIPLLLDWHRRYPPTAYESQCNLLAERLQGNRNPFIDYPELAEHLWGDRMDDPFLLPGAPVALRGSYTVDETIDLYSPWIPADASWQINGLPTSLSRLPAAELGVGTHRFTYSSKSTGERGQLLIKIERK
ncbi:MAG: endonuclease [Staphylococcus sp.]|nr:endonuclease [Staphylococcus sp.]